MSYGTKLRGDIIMTVKSFTEPALIRNPDNSLSTGTNNQCHWCEELVLVSANMV